MYVHCGLKFVVFFNFAAFLILRKKLWQNPRHFHIHSEIRGILIFLAVVMFAAKSVS